MEIVLLQGNLDVAEEDHFFFHVGEDNFIAYFLPKPGIDTNLPPVEDDSVWKRWMFEIDKTMTDLQAEGYADPCPANIVFFSNDPSHYLAEEQIGNDQDRLWIKPYEATSPRVPHPDSNMTERFMKSHTQRLAPPSDLPDF